MSLPESLRGRLRLPVVAAPMFLASGPELVVETCRAGVLGTFPALNQRTTEGLDEWLTQIEGSLAEPAAGDGPAPAPFGVNLIVHRTNQRVQADLERIVAHEVPVVITSLGASADVIEAVHSYGGVVFHDVTNAGHARKAGEAGVDGIICVSAGAGGHAGSINPFALLHEVRAVFDGTILLAGALSSGSDVLAAQAAGADLAYLGTRFLATREAMVGEDYKQMMVDSGAGDIVYTPAISSIPASFLRASIVAAGLDPDHLTAPDRVDLHHVTNPHEETAERVTQPESRPEAKAWRDVWSAGQGVAAVDTVLPVADLVERIAAEYDEAKGALRAATEELVTR